MHLLTILAFGIIFWRGEGYGQWVVVREGDICWTLAAVFAQPLLMGVATLLAARRSRRLLAQYGEEPGIAQQFYHRALFILRTGALTAFAATVFLTRWPEWLELASITPALQIVGDVVVLAPFVVTIVVHWVAIYPLERAFRSHGLSWAVDDGSKERNGWRFASYLDFHVRHYLLVVAVPITLILFTANMTRGYESQLQAWTGWVWTPDVLLGVVAVAVFVVAPAMLRRIWRTVSLEPGPVRERLEALCARIGLRCREILVWKTDGFMINAAVMGVFAPVRYVLLSDTMLATMSIKQIEAVFGHEAGHVRHRHIQHFLVFALAGWVIVAGVMELLARIAIGLDAPANMSAMTIQGIGVAATVLFWGVGFGWLSRRFERQADLFGARCVTPPGPECRLPCSVHPDDQTIRTAALPYCLEEGRVCATGAAVFASALDRVALLNGIPQEEWSWRHSSIGSRIRHLASLAGDPRRADRFDGLIRHIKTAMLVVAVTGLAATVWYWTVTPEPAILRLQSAP